jgi:hypothetical protein
MGISVKLEIMLAYVSFFYSVIQTMYEKRQQGLLKIYIMPQAFCLINLGRNHSGYLVLLMNHSKLLILVIPLVLI